MRQQVVEILRQSLEKHKPNLETVGIVGGSPSEPELKIIRELYPHVEVTFLGIEDTPNMSEFIFLDLNESALLSNKFDLIVCSQVLEHVWNIDNAIMLLSGLLTKDSGLIWINCPTSNMPHGSPHYFSAGYVPEMLSNLLLKHGVETLTSGARGTERLYYFTHALRYWPTTSELSHPVLTFRPLRSYKTRILQLSIKAFFGRLFSLAFSNRITNEIDSATETFVLGKTKAS